MSSPQFFAFASTTTVYTARGVSVDLHRVTCARLRRRTTALLHGDVTRRGVLLGAAVAVSATYDAWAKNYEFLDGRTAVTDLLGLTEARERIIQRARGDVLEIGVGTGLNLPLYERSSLTSLTGVDASNAMLKRAYLRARATGANLLRADVTALPFADETFDTVVDTFSLCTFDDAEAALREIRRVLKSQPTSRLLMVEHAASDITPLRLYQDITANTVTSLSKGCVWNQRVLQLAQAARFATLRRYSLLGGTVISLEMVPVE